MEFKNAHSHLRTLLALLSHPASVCKADAARVAVGYGWLTSVEVARGQGIETPPICSGQAAKMRYAKQQLQTDTFTVDPINALQLQTEVPSNLSKRTADIAPLQRKEDALTQRTADIMQSASHSADCDARGDVECYAGRNGADHRICHLPH